MDNAFLRLLFSKGMPDKSISIDVKIEEKSNHERRYTGRKMASLQSLSSGVGSLGPGNPDCRTPVTRQIVKLDTEIFREMSSLGGLTSSAGLAATVQPPDLRNYLLGITSTTRLFLRKTCI